MPDTTSKQKPARKPEKVIRRGAVSAEIHRMQSHDGFSYYGFSLVRHFKQADKERPSSSFFHTSVDDLIAAAQEAKNWIREQVIEVTH